MPALKTHLSLYLTGLFLVAGGPAGLARDVPLKPAGILRLDKPSGLYPGPVEVRMESDVPGGQIRWTQDGSLPDDRSAVLAGAPGVLTFSRSVVLRAAVWNDSGRVSAVETRSYLVLPDIQRQSGAGFPETWGIREGAVVRADYAMDPNVVLHPDYRERIVPALRSLPVVSLVADLADLFDPKRGIYSNPLESGELWERPVSFEYLPADGSAGVRVDCGIRIQGGWNRRPEESPKHSFRVVFRKRYGAARLGYPVFGAAAGEEFETLILRAGCNNTWLHWNGAERRRGDYIRDQWMRDTHRAMGHPAAAGRFVHLYLNGLYWGLYNLTERPAAAFAAAHLGGRADRYDARNGGNLLSGDDVAWQQLFALANAGVTNSATYAAIGELLDLPAFCDFMLLNLYGGNADWDRHSNWYAARRRPSGAYQFFIWDGERTLESPDANTLGFDDDFSPPRLFHRLRQNPEWRRLWSERARRHLGAGGALSPEAGAARFRSLADQIDLAVIAESARWGDYRRDVHRYKEGPYELYTRDEHWRPEIHRILRDFFPQRSVSFREQCRISGLSIGD